MQFFMYLCAINQSINQSTKMQSTKMRHAVLSITSRFIREHYPLFCGVTICILGAMFSLAESGYNYSKLSGQVFGLSMLCSFLCKTIPAYLIFVVLVRSLLQKGRYMAFWCNAIAILLAFVLLQMLGEKGIMMLCNSHSPQQNMSFAESAFDILSQNAQSFLVVLGFLVGFSFRFYSEAMEKSQLAATHCMEMKVRLLKKQVSPELLCDTVHHMGIMSKIDPTKTSNMLMKLSRLLRYQLYDGKREMLLLDSEIKFLRNYLSLMKDDGLCGDYQVETEGNTMGVMVPSMLFIPCIPLDGGKENLVGIKIKYADGCLAFCMNNPCDQQGMDVVKKRLDYLYPGKYDIQDSDPCRLLHFGPYNHQEMNPSVSIKVMLA